MNKKILIGSIIAVTILIGVSFTSVVGYNSIESGVKASPLFNIRTSRAIDEENKGIVCEYVGKGDGIQIVLPTYNYRNTKLQKAIDIISRMDDDIFKSYLNLIINRIRNNDKYDEVNINEVIATIQQIRNNPQTIIVDESKNSISTIGFDFTPTICWFPGCIPLQIVGRIIYFIFIIFLAFVYVIFDVSSDCVQPT